MAKVYFNDRLMDETAAGLSVSDSGFLYGVGLFEQMRAVDGRLFALAEHLDRLLAGAQRLQVPCPMSRDDLARAVQETLEANDLKEARIRLTLTGGLSDASGQARPTLLISAGPFQPYPTSYYEKGVTVALSDIRLNPTDPTARWRTTSFLPRLLALSAAHRKGATEALWFTPDGLLADGCLCNVFLVRGKTLLTPELGTPVVPGVARRHVLELAAELKMPAEEKELTIQDLLTAEEVFITNVTMTVMPVVGIEAHTVGEGKVGPIAKKLLDAFQRRLGEFGRAAADQDTSQEKSE